MAFAAMIDGEGEVTDFLRLKHLMKRKNSWKEQEREEKVSSGCLIQPHKGKM